jgi:hypothetical protein
MTSLIDPVNEPGDLDGLEASLKEATTVPDKDPAKAVTPEAETTVVPDKYKGKSIDDVIAMHQNAETRLGEMGNEVGSYKKMTDRLLALETKRSDDLISGGATPEDVSPVEITSTELLDNPTEAISKVVKSAVSDAIKPIGDRLDTSDLETLETQFASKHPDAGTIAHDDKFLNWCRQSPTRLRAAQAAATGAWDQADDLLTEWKDSIKPAPEDDTLENQDAAAVALEAARKAGTESKGASGPADAPTGKVYRRIDLIEMKLKRPAVYEDPGFQAEIMKAYAEGRVK